MVAISAARMVSTHTDRVWEIISDMDDEPRHWRGLDSIRNIAEMAT